MTLFEKLLCEYEPLFEDIAVRGSVGGFLENVREIVFVDEKRVRNRVEGQILVDIFGYIVDCSAYASVGCAVGKVLLVVLQKELRKGD